MADVQASLDALQQNVLGSIIRPDSADYDTARRVWNGTIDRRPAAIVKALGPADAIATVRVARETGAPLAVRSGGHSVPGFSTCDDGIVLDLGMMRGVRVDPEARTAQVAGGTLLGELDHETLAFGLATTTGTVAHTGVAGLTLGGGLGRLHRKHGLSIDNLLSVDLVTADGRLVRASDEENPELFWAVRGAGPNFGVVTRLEFRLHPLNPIAYGAIALYPLEEAAGALRAFREYATKAPDEMLSVAGLITVGPEGPFPPHLHGQKALQLAVSIVNLDEDEAKRVAEPALSAATSPLMKAFIPAPYLFFQKMMDERYRWDRRYYVKGGYVEELTDATIDTLLTLFASAPGPGTEIALMTLGGAMSRIPDDATAFTGRDAEFFAGVELTWDDPAEDAAQFEWGRGAMAAIAPHLGGGNYVNALVEAPEDTVRAAYGDEKYKRLVELKRVWDPQNVFRMNTNIRP